MKNKNVAKIWHKIVIQFYPNCPGFCNCTNVNQIIHLKPTWPNSFQKVQIPHKCVKINPVLNGEQSEINTPVQVNNYEVVINFFHISPIAWP